MKVKTNVLEFPLGHDNLKDKFISWKCDKCGMVGSTLVKPELNDLPDDKKKCCEEN